MPITARNVHVPQVVISEVLEVLSRHSDLVSRYMWDGILICQGVHELWELTPVNVKRAYIIIKQHITTCKKSIYHHKTTYNNIYHHKNNI